MSIITLYKLDEQKDLSPTCCPDCVCAAAAVCVRVTNATPSPKPQGCPFQLLKKKKSKR